MSELEKCTDYSWWQQGTPQPGDLGATRPRQPGSGEAVGGRGVLSFILNFF